MQNSIVHKYCVRGGILRNYIMPQTPKISELLHSVYPLNFIYTIFFYFIKLCMCVLFSTRDQLHNNNNQCVYLHLLLQSHNSLVPFIEFSCLLPYTYAHIMVVLRKSFEFFFWRVNINFGWMDVPLGWKWFILFKCSQCMNFSSQINQHSELFKNNIFIFCYHY